MFSLIIYDWREKGGRGQPTAQETWVNFPIPMAEVRKLNFWCLAAPSLEDFVQNSRLSATVAVPR